MRKVIHIDMDCFYAAVEVRDNPALSGLPVAVSWTGPRSVVLTANYEARRYGVHSALATRIALERCPELTLVAPRMEVYRQASKDIREVFFRFLKRPGLQEGVAVVVLLVMINGLHISSLATLLVVPLIFGASRLKRTSIPKTRWLFYAFCPGNLIVIWLLAGG